MMSSSQEMSLSVNGQSQVPPGFRFHPTEEELLHYYLRKKVAYQKIDLDVIRDVDLNKLEPWDIQEKCKIGSGPQNDWYFFSHKDKKYPTGTRTNRATTAGFWKATGRDKVIYSSLRRIGMRKTLVFYKGRAPHGQKSDWIMHEYRLDDIIINSHHPLPPEDSTTCTQGANNSVGDSTSSEDGWVVCRVFRKKNYQKSTPEYCPSNTTTTTNNNNNNKGSMDIIRASLQQMPNICGGDEDHSTTTSNLHPHGGVLDQIFMYMGMRSCKQEDEINTINPTITNSTTSIACQGIDGQRFVHLPRLDSPSRTRLHPNTTSFSNNNINNYNYNYNYNNSSSSIYQQQHQTIGDIMFAEETEVEVEVEGGVCCRNQQQLQNKSYCEGDWVALDRLVASQLNGQAVETDSLTFGTTSLNSSPPPPPDNTTTTITNDDDDDCVGFADDIIHQPSYSSSDSDLWSFNRSSSSSSSHHPHPLSHLSV